MAHDDDFWLALFEVLIPADEARGMPSAALPAILPTVRDRLSAVPEMAQFVETSLDCLRDKAAASDPSGFASIVHEERIALLKSVEEEQPLGLRALAFNLFAVYYQQPEVLAALGLPARAPFPMGFDLEGNDDVWFEKAQARATRGN